MKGNVHMHKYISEFLNTKNASQLQAFFNALEKKSADSLFLMAKRVLYFYFLTARELTEYRFLGRCHCFEDYMTAPQALEQYQTIYLAGDTMSSGYQMFRYYCILKKVAEDHRIVSIVYALSTEFPRDSLCERMYRIYYEVYGVAPADQAGKYQEAAARMWKDFKSNLYCHWYLNQENISLFNLDETRLLQREALNVMSASIAVDYARAGESVAPVRMWLETLCQDAADWRYVPLNLAGVSKEVFDGGVQMGYFEYRGVQSPAHQSSLLLNSVVLCKYCDAQEGEEPTVIFSPLAIGRSCTENQLREFFHKTVGTVFSDEWVKEEAERFGGRDPRLMYRLLLNIFSLQIGIQFQKLLQAKGLSAAEYAGSFANLPFADAVCVQATDMVERAGISAPPHETQEAVRSRLHIEAVCHMVKNEILRRESNASVPVSVEDIERFLLEKQCAETSGEIKSLLTGVLLLLMETAVCSSMVFIADGMVQNAFVPEENANCLLSDAEILGHICADVLYIAQGANEYETQKSSFLEQMQGELESMGTFEDGLSEESFSDYRSMLEVASGEDVQYKILGKRFLVRNLNGLLKNVQELAIQKAEGMIKRHGK